MMSRVIERTIFFAIGFGLITLAFLPRLRAGIPDSALFVGCSAILLAAGFRQLAIAPRLADEVSRKMTHASALRRLLLPAHWYTRHVLLWQFRIISVLMIVMAFMTAFVAFLAYRRGL
jgi:hypothetical protein